MALGTNKTQTNRNICLCLDRFKSIRNCYPLKSELVGQSSRAPTPEISLFFYRSRTKERVKRVSFKSLYISKLCFMCQDSDPTFLHQFLQGFGFILWWQKSRSNHQIRKFEIIRSIGVGGMFPPRTSRFWEEDLFLRVSNVMCSKRVTRR